MSEDISKSVRFIAKLLELTQDGHLSWEIGAEESFTTNLEGRILKIHQVRRRADPAGSGKNATRTWLGTPAFKNVVALELLNEEGKVTFKFENVAGMRDLWQAVNFSASKVDDFIDKVLKM
ncbi:hypothetical protein [Methylorubrum extorquens]